MEYWEECISEAFDEAGISSTEEQIAIVVDIVKGSHENYGMAHGYDAIPNPLFTENTQLKKQLKEEQDKVLCKECKGSCVDISYGGTFRATSQCWKCKGEGRHNP